MQESREHPARTELVPARRNEPGRFVERKGDIRAPDPRTPRTLADRPRKSPRPTPRRIHRDPRRCHDPTAPPAAHRRESTSPHAPDAGCRERRSRRTRSTRRGSKAGGARGEGSAPEHPQTVDAAGPGTDHSITIRRRRRLAGPEDRTKAALQVRTSSGSLRKSSRSSIHAFESGRERKRRRAARASNRRGPSVPQVLHRPRSLQRPLVNSLNQEEHQQLPEEPLPSNSSTSGSVSRTGRSPSLEETRCERSRPAGRCQRDRRARITQSTLPTTSSPVRRRGGRRPRRTRRARRRRSPQHRPRGSRPCLNSGTRPH